ncbi:hypothetical protein [Paractinoplanes durhamensis]|uniref:hypothetical protein n=1 Tax=Paractinoplanes durhamensis TaxID=113563 RepID=UPI0031E0A5A3
MSDTDLEQRVRRALEVRAADVTGQGVRPAADPARAETRRWWLPLSAGLAAAAVSILVFALLRPPAPVAPPVMPGSSPAPAASSRPTPTPTATSSQAGPIPSTSASASASASAKPETASPASTGPVTRATP